MPPSTSSCARRNAPMHSSISTPGKARPRWRRRSMSAADVHARDVHVVIGDPVTAIPEFVARHSYEILVLGALTHRHSMTALLGTLTGRLIETVGCDLLLVRASPEAAAAELSAA
ncbi:MAG: universal stress protein [Gammaproteobacteria bacterium]|nr:MAG: universal stress protein [Gammaproteobacteria bacterium]